MNKQAFLSGYLGRPLSREAFYEGYLNKEAGWVGDVTKAGVNKAKTAGKAVVDSIKGFFHPRGVPGNPNIINDLMEANPDVAQNILESVFEDATRLGLKGQAFDDFMAGRIADIASNIGAVKPGLVSKIVPPAVGVGVGVGGTALGAALLKRRADKKKAQALDEMEGGAELPA